jgi:putative acetyltransferase
VKIVPVNTPEQIQQVRKLFEEYAASLSFDLCFQNFQQELDRLPGCYALPDGRLWLAITDSGEAAGCVALRRLEPGIGEMKRLYVRLEHRGTGLGKRLAQKVIDEARDIAYQRIRLDTTSSITEAIRLYESLGFTCITPYRPLDGSWPSGWRGASRSSSPWSRMGGASASHSYIPRSRRCR